MSMLDEFVRVFELPPAMAAHIDFVAQGREMELVVGLDKQALTLDQVAEMMKMPRDECEAFLQAAYYRQLISRKTEDGVTLYRPGKFYRSGNEPDDGTGNSGANDGPGARADVHRLDRF